MKQFLPEGTAAAQVRIVDAELRGRGGHLRTPRRRDGNTAERGGSEECGWVPGFLSTFRPQHCAYLTIHIHMALGTDQRSAERATCTLELENEFLKTCTSS